MRPGPCPQTDRQAQRSCQARGAPPPPPKGRTPPHAQRPSTTPQGLPSPSRVAAHSLSAPQPRLAPLHLPQHSLGTGTPPARPFFQALPSAFTPASALWSSVLGEETKVGSKGEGQASHPPTERPCRSMAQDGLCFWLAMGPRACLFPSPGLSFPIGKCQDCLLLCVELLHQMGGRV